MPSNLGKYLETGGPGRPKGSVGGRRKALQAMDKLLAEKGSIEALEGAWRKALEKNPLGFWKKVVEPLIPKDMRLELSGHDGGPLLGMSWADFVKHLQAEQDGKTGNGGNGNGGASTE